MVEPVRVDPPLARAAFIDVKTGFLTPHGLKVLGFLRDRTGGYDDFVAEALGLGLTAIAQQGRTDSRLAEIEGSTKGLEGAIGGLRGDPRLATADKALSASQDALAIALSRAPADLSRRMSDLEGGLAGITASVAETRAQVVNAQRRQAEAAADVAIRATYDIQLQSARAQQDQQQLLQIQEDFAAYESGLEEAIDDRVAVFIQNGTGISWSYSDIAGTLTPTVSLVPFSTTNLTEGASLYFTNERAQDAVGAMVDASLVYVDGTPLLTRAALTGDAAAAQGSNALTLATVNASVGSFGSATQAGTFTVNAKGLITAAANVTVTPAVGSITGLGTSVAAALAVAVGSAGAFTTLNGALGTPSSGTLTNCTGLPVAGITASTSTALGVGSLNIGHASDTTLARSGAGDLTIEGNAIYRAGGTDVPVTDGGTGRSTSTTAYGLIAAGTTATGAHQTLAAGATTEVLVGGGASALPVWTAATGSGAPVRATSPTLTTATLSGATTLPGGGVIEADGDVGIGVGTVTAIYGRTLQIGSGTTESSLSLKGSTGDFYAATVGAKAFVVARNGMALALCANDTEYFTITTAGRLLGALPTYADNAAAVAGGLAATTFYKTAAGDVRIVV